MSTARCFLHDMAGEMPKEPRTNETEISHIPHQTYPRQGTMDRVHTHTLA